jgi:NAD(P)H-flavin reductase
MLFGVRFENEIYYKAELDQIRARIPNFDYQFVVSRPTEGWGGLKGYVQNHIQQFSYLTVPTHFYLCGNGSMIKDVKARLADEGFDEGHIIAEAFN